MRKIPIPKLNLTTITHAIPEEATRFIYLSVAGEESLISAMAQRSSLVVNVQALARLVADTTAARATTFGGGAPFSPL